MTTAPTRVALAAALLAAVAGCGDSRRLTSLGAGPECARCHGAPPATGAHLVHANPPSVWNVTYGALHLVERGAVSGPTSNDFGCGHCHPLDLAQHYAHVRAPVNGVRAPDVVLSPAGAEATSLKRLNHALATYDPVTRTCSGVYCHSSAKDPATMTLADYRTTPAWDAPSGPLGCDGCHGAPSPTGAHPVHASPPSAAGVTYGALHVAEEEAPGGARYDLGCGNCHPLDRAHHLAHLAPRVEGAHVPDVVLDAAGAPASTHKGRNHALATYDPATGTCSGVYCHSAARDPAAMAIADYRTTPAWSAASISLGCDGCHGAPSATGAHLVHADPPSVSSVTYGALHVAEEAAPSGGARYDLGCGNCHPLDRAQHLPHVASSGGAHVPDVVVDPGAAPAASLKARNHAFATYETATRTCSGVYCHSSAQDPAAMAIGDYRTTPAWDAPSTSLGCDGCHGAPSATGAHPVHASPPSVSSVAYGALHVVEAATPAGGATYDLGCGNCHPLDRARHLAHASPPAPGGAHVSDVVLDGAGAPATSLKGGNHALATYDPATRTCSGVYCHSSARDPAAMAIADYRTTPAWNGPSSSLGCDGCHGAPSPTGAHPVHADPPSVSSVAYGALHVVEEATPAGGATYDLGCGNCHPLDRARHLAHVAPAAPGGARAPDVALDAAGAPASTHKGRNHALATYDPAAGTCSGVYCHSDARDPAAMAVGDYRTTPAWDAAPTSLGCDGCHGAPPANGAHLVHADPPSVSSVTYGDLHVVEDPSGGGSHDFGCGNCHPLDRAQHLPHVASSGGGAHVPDVVVEAAGAPASSLKGGNHALADYDPATRTCGGVYCHSSAQDPASMALAAYRTTPAWDASASLGCDGCHGAPSATGAHLVHANPLSLSSVGYGALHVLEDVAPSGGPSYDFGCGNCHPLDPAQHLAHVADPVGGARVPDVALDRAGAPATSLKGRNGALATYDRPTRTCSAVYCHSSGQDPAALTTLAYRTTPAWDAPPQALGCDGCHGNPPRYPSGGAGATAANGHLGFDAFGWETGHYAGMPGPAHSYPSKHGGGSRGYLNADPVPAAAPITCQACHAETVDPDNVTTGGFFWLDTTGEYQLPGGDAARLGQTSWLITQCSHCHYDGGPAPVGSGRVLPLRHVNGRRDVTFDRRPALPAAYGGLPPVTGPVPPYYVTYFTGKATRGYSEFPVDGVLLATSAASQPVFATSLESAVYDPATKTCSNIGCHVGRQSLVDAEVLGSLRWGGPRYEFGPSCGNCHQGF